MTLKAFKEASHQILTGVKDSVQGMNPIEIERMIAMIMDSSERRILIVGTGRSSLVGRAFAMRLMHLGFDVHVLGETITPSIRRRDIVVAISGSGSTLLPVASARIAKKAGARIIAITSNPRSSLGRLADHVVRVRAKYRPAREKDFFMRQLLGEHESLMPLGTMFELSAGIFLDCVIAEMMSRLGETEGDLEKRLATI